MNLLSCFSALAGLLCVSCLILPSAAAAFSVGSLHIPFTWNLPSLRLGRPQQQPPCECQQELQRLRRWHRSLEQTEGILDQEASSGVSVAAAGELPALILKPSGVRRRRLLQEEEGSDGSAQEGGRAGEGKGGEATEQGKGEAGERERVGGHGTREGGGGEGAAGGGEEAAEGESKEREGVTVWGSSYKCGKGARRVFCKKEREWEKLSVPDLWSERRQQEEELKKIAEEATELKAELRRLTYQKSRHDLNLTQRRTDFSETFLTPKVLGKARSLLKRCNKPGWVLSKPAATWRGYACSADDDMVAKYLTYKERELCPDDWPEIQHMIFVENCFSLPKRRCLTLTSARWSEPLPFPQSLFDQRALKDENVRWTQHDCKSYECLNTRLLGDCRNCFQLDLEHRRWRRAYRGSLPMKEVIAMKNGTLRIGLDAGGGSGSFAAHMAVHGVTVMTTAMNIETVKGRSKGLPYMETIAQRGLIPLHLPHKSRLPFFDNTLDVIHCVNSVKYLPILEFEELLFEWDRVLRVGGIMWFEMFYAPVEEMPVYVAIIEQLGYAKLHWNVLPKPDFGEKPGIHLYLNCVIEKPVRMEPHSWLFG